MSTPNDELVRQVASAKECSEWDSERMLDEQFVETEFQVLFGAFRSLLGLLSCNRCEVE